MDADVPLSGATGLLLGLPRLELPVGAGPATAPFPGAVPPEGLTPHALLSWSGALPRGPGPIVPGWPDDHPAIS